MTTNIFEKGCLIHLTVSIFTGRVKLPKSAIHVDADPAFINATKFLNHRGRRKTAWISAEI